jgi:hypothetical protein
MNGIHGATFGLLTLKENGIEYPYASPDRYPDVRATVGQVSCAVVLNTDPLLYTIASLNLSSPGL